MVYAIQETLQEAEREEEQRGLSDLSDELELEEIADELAEISRCTQAHSEAVSLEEFDTAHPYISDLENGSQSLTALLSDGELEMESSSVNVSSFVRGVHKFKQFVSWLWERLKELFNLARRKTNELLMKLFSSTGAMRRELDKRRRRIRQLRRQNVSAPGEALNPRGLFYLHISRSVDIKNVISAIDRDFEQIDAIKQTYVNRLPELYQLQSQAAEVFTKGDMDSFDKLKSKLDRDFEQEIGRINGEVQKAHKRIEGEELPGGRKLVLDNERSALSGERQDVLLITLRNYRGEEVNVEDLDKIYAADLDTLEKLVDTVDRYSDQLEHWQGPMREFIDSYDDAIENINSVIEQGAWKEGEGDEQSLQKLRTEQQSYFRSRMKSARANLMNTIGQLMKYQFSVLRACDRYLEKSIRAYERANT